MLCTSSISIINVNDGEKGDTGTSILSAREQWYLSTSSSELIGGSWSYTEPSSIPSGKYLWGRWEYTMSDNTFSYSDAVHRSVISGLVNLTDNINNSITNKVWQSDITQKVNEYDNTTGKSIRDRVTSTESNINGIWTSISDQSAQTVTKPDGTVVQGLAYKVHNVEDTAESHTRTIGTMQTDITKVKTDLSTLEVGGRNLLMNSDFRFDMNVTTSANPYGLYQRGNVYSADIVNTPSHNGKKSLKIVGSAAGSTSGSDILWQSTLVKAGMGAGSITGRKIILSFWAKADSVDNESHELQPCVVGFRTAYSGYQERKYVTLTDQWQRYSIVITGGADDEKAVAAEAPTLIFYSTVKCIFYLSECMLEMGSVQSDWVGAPEDTELEANSIRTIATQAADHFSWLVDANGTETSFTLKDRVSELVAQYINLHGKVSFYGLDSNAQQRVEDAENGVSTAQEMATDGLGIKINYSAIATAANGQCYLHGFDLTGSPTDTDGYVYWHGKKITVPKKRLNPNNKLPFYTTIYIVLRLTNSTALTGTLYMVYYDTTASVWKCGVTPSPSAVDTFALAQATDIVLGQFVLPSNGGKVTDAYLYNPPRGTSEITTGGNSYQYAKGSVDWFNTNGSAVVEAKNILNSWKGEAEQGVTTINGGLIQTHTVMAEQLATNAIMSSNYQSGVVNSYVPSDHYSTSGTFLNLADGAIYSKNFCIDTNGSAYFTGTINATSGSFSGTVNANKGQFGNSINYWNIENIYDYYATDRIALVATGEAYIQTGNWQMGNNAIATRKYTSTDSYSGRFDYYSNSGTFYDFGMKIPTSFSVPSTDTDVTRYQRSFFYGRKYTGNSSQDLLDSQWDYLYMIDSLGTLYVKNIIVTGGNASTFLPTTGGTISGNLSVNGTITTGSGLTGALSINGKTYNGSANINVGTIGAGYGGTGCTTLNASANALINSLTTGAGNSTVLNDNVQFITQDANTANTGYYRRTMLVLWNYIKSKIQSDPPSYDSIDTTELTVGNLIVTGSARFGNGLAGNLTGNVTGNLTGTASHASKVYDVDGTHEITFRYSGAGVSSATWFPAWSGYNIVPISADNTRAAISAMYYPKLTSAVTTDSLTTEGLYRIQFPHTGDTSYPTGHYGDLFSSNHGTAYQIWLPDNSTQVWKRIYNNSTATWGAWSNAWDITASRATFATSAGYLTTRSFTIGESTQNVNWSGAVSYSKSQIAKKASDLSTDTDIGWMTKAQATKLDSINVSVIDGSLQASGIIGGQCINVTKNSSNQYVIATQGDYLTKNGGTMTGQLNMSNCNIKIFRESNPTDNDPAAMVFEVKDSTTGYSSTGAIKVFHDHNSAQSYGTNMVVNCAGNLFLGGGEAAENVYRASYTTNQSENLFLLSDGVIYIEGYCQDNDGANRKGMIVYTDANSHCILPSVAATLTNNVGYIGNSSYKWAGMYATTFHGALDGNASTATVANRLPGFSTGASPSSNITWGNQTGTAVYSSSTSDNCAFYFRKNNPSTGQLSLLVDGVFYQREGQYMCLDTGNYSSYALPLSGGTITGALTVNGVTTHKNEVIIQTTTVGSNAYNSANPKLTFKNSGGDQNVQLVMTDYDAVVGPASLTLTGNQNGTNGGEYFIAPNIRANTRMELSTGAYLQYVSATKSINFVFR